MINKYNLYYIISNLTNNYLEKDFQNKVISTINSYNRNVIIAYNSQRYKNIKIDSELDIVINGKYKRYLIEFKRKIPNTIKGKCKVLLQALAYNQKTENIDNEGYVGLIIISSNLLFYVFTKEIIFLRNSLDSEIRNSGYSPSILWNNQCAKNIILNYASKINFNETVVTSQTDIILFLKDVAINTLNKNY